MPDTPEGTLLGHIAHDPLTATNERVLLRAPRSNRPRLLRNQFVIINDVLSSSVFLGRLLSGPFFPPDVENDIFSQVEIQGELDGLSTRDTNNRPAPGSAVHEMRPGAVSEMLCFDGDVLLGCMSGREDLPVSLQSLSKDVLPRNIGIFGTVGSGKSNTVQVLIEGAAASGWAVVMLDLEAEYTEMDQPTEEKRLIARLASLGYEPRGLPDFHVYHPVSCPSDRPDSQAFSLRLADFDSSITGELLQTTLAERNALLDCIDHFEHKFHTKVATSDLDRLHGLLDPSPQAKLPYTLQQLRARATERAPRNSEALDYVGLGSKLQMLLRSSVFDQPNLKSLDPGEMLKPGRVNVLDVSVANDMVKNLVTADLLRKTFAWKIAHVEAPPTLLVIEEAHSFMSREKIHALQATLQMLRNVTRRGRKRWLALAFVSQQPGHLPPEIFELCNTRFVHTLRSMHNLDALMATTSDVTQELWARCPLLGTGEAIVSTPQFRRTVIVSMRPAASRRRFVR